ncbi:hypothetical protein ASPCAL13372 [Aspergillus calidoustus]|uniref:Uncharacterized protein n=1 Tax=Aspergillus calidoustus TaxID=454130 RepID=A0A0U5CHI3_ASPCI|nr:hypothetical protein ASPCAL13372 [Aspergillus calidoustus]
MEPLYRILRILSTRKTVEMARQQPQITSKADECLLFSICHFAVFSKGTGWICDDIVRSMMDAEDLYACEIVQTKLPSLYKGRFVLVRDAGYAGAAGAGTSLALVGAYVLAGDIKRHQGDLARGTRSVQ